MKNIYDANLEPKFRIELLQI